MSIAGAALVDAAGRRMGVTRSTGVLLGRHLTVFSRNWTFFVTGFAEPVLYLLSIGVGVGKLIPSFDVGGHTIAYAAFVAPGMLAASAMNGAVMDATFNVFFRLKYQKLYDQILATPLTTGDVARSEITWALLRGGVYSAGFLVVMSLFGLIHSWWALLALPAALLIGFAFGAVGMALTTFMKSWQDFEYITLSTVPMFLFSATFFPASTFPTWLQWVIDVTPLYRGVVLCRELTTGQVTWGSGISLVYLIVLGCLGMVLVGKRLERLLLT
ncbi:ABC transporter permease [Leekyejoonella antrihumi]|uniref:Transport permease protein n=1 Tax=Leekyejoonella antrihumi TaxID=1660198 RepID=A0A563E3D8_9MICO|nr:ABC transporter permease [Leekyejoonella antrihumi]TWP37037.1 ABC transporter [Leekyejoonella antrihumi]